MTIQRIKHQGLNLALASTLAATLTFAVACDDDPNPSPGDASADVGGTGGKLSGSGGGTGTGGVVGTGGAGTGGAGTGGAGTGGAGTGGTGGSAPGDGGTEAGDAGETGPAGTCNVPCLQNLVEACPAVGACVEQNAIGGADLVSNTCYANGVKSKMTISLPGINLTYYKAGGGICWSMVIAGSGTGTATITVKNAAGVTVATGTSDETTMKQTVMCNGQSYDISSCVDSPGPAGDAGAGAMCTEGTCVVP